MDDDKWSTRNSGSRLAVCNVLSIEVLTQAYGPVGKDSVGINLIGGPIGYFPVTEVRIGLRIDHASKQCIAL